MMIGDGANDISAIKKADIGVGVIGENKTVQNISDVVIDSWTKIPAILDEFKRMQAIINNVCQWVLLKHMLNPSSHFAMMLVSFYENLRDPASPFLMAFMNAVCGLYIVKYAKYENIYAVQNNININKWVIEGTILGFLNGLYIFSMFPNANGIYVSIASQILILAIKIDFVEVTHILKHRFLHYTSCMTILCILWFLSNLSFWNFFHCLAMSFGLFWFVDKKLFT